MKQFRIILKRNEEIIPQYGLEFDSKEVAQQKVDYLNSRMPKNLQGTVSYYVGSISEKNFKYYLQYDYNKRMMKVVEIDERKIKPYKVRNTMKYQVKNNEFVEHLFNTIPEAVASLGDYFFPIMLPNGKLYVAD